VFCIAKHNAENSTSRVYFFFLWITFLNHPLFPFFCLPFKIQSIITLTVVILMEDSYGDFSRGAVLEFELSASCLWGRCFSTWVTPSALNCGDCLLTKNPHKGTKDCFSVGKDRIQWTEENGREEVEDS
jgi:hypothetical protein